MIDSFHIFCSDDGIIWRTKCIQGVPKYLKVTLRRCNCIPFRECMACYGRKLTVWFPLCISDPIGQKKNGTLNAKRHEWQTFKFQIRFAQQCLYFDSLPAPCSHDFSHKVISSTCCETLHGDMLIHCELQFASWMFNNNSPLHNFSGSLWHFREQL